MSKRLALVAMVALTLAVTPFARADGDPASDWLLSQPSFVPGDDGVPSAYTTQLNAVLSDAKARGYEIRVAIIGTRYDMGSVYIDWLKPKRYVPFLSHELFFVYKGRVLVAMPNGLAISDGDGRPAPAADVALVNRLPHPGKDPAALTSAATNAVDQARGEPRRDRRAAEARPRVEVVDEPGPDHDRCSCSRRRRVARRRRVLAQTTKGGSVKRLPAMLLSSSSSWRAAGARSTRRRRRRRPRARATGSCCTRRSQRRHSCSATRRQSWSAHSRIAVTGRSSRSSTRTAPTCAHSSRISSSPRSTSTPTCG